MILSPTYSSFGHQNWVQNSNIYKSRLVQLFKATLCNAIEQFLNEICSITYPNLVMLCGTDSLNSTQPIGEQQTAKSLASTYEIARLNDKTYCRFKQPKCQLRHSWIWYHWVEASVYMLRALWPRSVSLPSWLCNGGERWGRERSDNIEWGREGRRKEGRKGLSCRGFRSTGHKTLSNITLYDSNMA